MRKLLWITLAALAIAPSPARAEVPQAPVFAPIFGDEARAMRARDAITEMDLVEAQKILDGADMTDTALAIERGRYLLHAGDYDGAAAHLARPDLAATREGAMLGDIARGCARATAATVEVRDETGGVLVRLQDDDDRALVPLLSSTALRVREQLIKDLGVELPKPLRIDLVRDQFSLAAMTGLPEEAAKTTGTVAVAKWGRVTMISPRAAPRGYPWLDTLAHEMTHLALTKGTRDNAPLWLQEGVAKREETRWRAPEPFDDVPPVDAIAAIGLEKGLGRPITNLGPSIAMLPTPEQAHVAFAEVSSFIRFWAKEAGEGALPQLVIKLKASPDVSRAIFEITNADFAAWEKRWLAHLSAAPRDIPAALAPGAAIPGRAEIVKRVRLGGLLEGRGHHKEAAGQFARAQVLVPTDASVRCFLAAAALGAGDRGAAERLVERVEDVHGRYGRWWSLHGLLHPGLDAERSFALGVALDPLDPFVACEEKAPPALPSDPLRAAICAMARRAPVE